MQKILNKNLIVYNNIVKPVVDQRLYRGLELENGIKCLLISDPKTDKSAASVNVNIGSLLDPIPGLAHFCEHMLFMGSKKYPVENAFAKYIKDHAGVYNAYTSYENTNYYFDIANDSLKDALDIFSQFFISPLFDESSTEREINAVNSENNKNLKLDLWRLKQFEKSLCKPSHPYSKFSTGNIETLKTEPEKAGLNIRDELIKFHTEYYSSNLMTASILGVDSLDVLQEYAVSMFSDIPNKGLSKIQFDINPYSEEAFKNIYYVVPVQDIHRLNLIFQLPDYQDYYESNPTGYLSHLVGHEGPGSLLSELKARAWCNGLSSSSRLGARGFQFFKVSIELSEEGINHIQEILQLKFQYLNLLRKEGIQKWLFDEQVDIGKIKFGFKDIEKPIDYVSSITNDLTKYKIEDVLRANYHGTEFKPKLIEEVLNLIRPELMVTIVVSKKFEGTTDKTEKWYGTQHRSEPISGQQLGQLKNCGLNEAFKLPEPNSFIPTEFSLITHSDGISKLPELIKKTSLFRLWYKGDDSFLLPKAKFIFELRNPLSILDPKHSNMTYLLGELITDSLNEYAYAAELAGLRYNIQQTNYGIKFTFSGFDHKLDALIEKVVSRLATFKIDEKRFNVLREQHKRQLQNFQTRQPYDHAMFYLGHLMIEKGWTPEETLQEIENYTLTDLQAFLTELLTSGVFFEAIMFGNVSKEKTIKIVENIESHLNKVATESNRKLTTLLPSQLDNNRCLQLQNLCDLIYHKNNNIHQTIAIESYFQCIEQSTHNNVVAELFCQIISEATFDTLRTKEQLGYIVSSSCKKLSGTLGVRFLIQSDRSPVYLDDRIENYINSIKKMLEEMNDEDFKKQVEALKVIKLKKPKTISEQCEIYWNEISIHQYNFDRSNIEVECLATITKKDIIEFYDDFIASTGTKRKKLAVFVNPESRNSEIDEIIKTKIIKDVSKFKAHLPLYPLAKSYIDI